MNEFIERYLKNGFSIIPIPFREKGATIKWEQYQKKRATEGQIKSWFSQDKSNIAIICGEVSGNLLVVDCDSKDKWLEFKPLAEKKLGLDDLVNHTPVVKTGKGYHIYFRTPTPIKSVKFPRLDLKAEGGYVIAPPSVHPNGQTYSFVNPNIPDIFVIANLEDIGLDIKKQEERTKQPNWISDLLAKGASEGERNDNCTQLAGYFRNIEPIEITSQILLGWNIKNKPPLPDKEVLTTIASVYKYSPKPVSNTNNLYGLNTYKYRRGQYVPLDTKGTEKGTEIGTAEPAENEKGDNLPQRILEWVEETTGWWANADLDYDLGITRQNDKDNRKKILQRLAVKGIIENNPKSNRLHRFVNTRGVKMNYKLAEKKAILSLKWPFGLENYCDIYGGNIAVVAGAPDAGKTALLLNFIRLNQDKFPIYYFCSEMGESELQNRLQNFEGITLNDWKFESDERSSNFADVIRPDCINIIDYMEISTDLYLVADYLKAIHEKLGTGIALVALQKKVGARLGRGAEFSLEKPRLYLSMDNSKLTIIKAKNWHDKTQNPNNRKWTFKLLAGCNFVNILKCEDAD